MTAAQSSGGAPKAALYCRLSEEDRNKASPADDSASIQNQKSMLLHYAAEKGWEVFRIYSDDDYTGSDRNRPEFQRLLTDAKAHKFDIVLCKTQSRFTRERHPLPGAAGGGHCRPLRGGGAAHKERMK